MEGAFTGTIQKANAARQLTSPALEYIMRNRFHLAINKGFLAACSLLLAQPLLALWPATDGQGDALPSLAPLVESATPAVVNIATSTTQQSNNPLFNDPFFKRFFNVPQRRYRARKVQSAGSGVVLDAGKGIVVTNHHVIKNADEIRVILYNGDVRQAELLGSDPEVDIAVLKIEAKGLQEVKLANSDAARVGDFVIAIGNPFGLNQTVTTGIVSALGRTGLGIEGVEDFIQTDASINPGNSGGALLNLRGELLGINTAILAPSGGNVGIGFAIPSNMAMASVSQLLEYGEVQRGDIGIRAQDIDSQLAQAFDLDSRDGALVNSVEPGSPADKAGLQSGDIITAVNKKATRSASELRTAIALQRIGSQIDVRYLREGKERRGKVQIVDPLDYQSNQLQSPIAVYLEGARYKEDPKLGLQVVSVEPGSNAWQAGLRDRDIILAANRRRVSKIEHLDKALQYSRRQILLHLLRGNAELQLVIR